MDQPRGKKVAGLVPVNGRQITGTGTFFERDTVENKK
jgi:hypothetical protein